MTLVDLSRPPEDRRGAKPRPTTDLQFVPYFPKSVDYLVDIFANARNAGDNDFWLLGVSDTPWVEVRAGLDRMQMDLDDQVYLYELDSTGEETF